MVAVDVVDEMDDAEFCRWTVLRGGAVLNIILLTSSEFMVPKPVVPLALHPSLVFGWKVRGEATAVIGDDDVSVVVVVVVDSCCSYAGTVQCVPVPSVSYTVYRMLVRTCS